jgi:hypothetical protein
MDFSLIERHPWATTGIVLGGGFLLFLIFRRRGSSAQTAGATVVQSTGVDAATMQAELAAQAQANQIQGQLSGLTIQGGTQVQLATIASQVQQQTVAATQDVTNQQTAAQLQLGLGTIQGQVAQSQISADVQIAAINAIVGAYRGNNGTNPVASIPSVATPNIPSTPVNTQTPVFPAMVSPPTYPVSNPVGGNPSISTYPFNGNISAGNVVAGALPLAGGALLAPAPTYTPVGAWPDANVVAANQQTQINYENADLQANATNNRNQCLANAALSQGRPGYGSILSACG